MTELAEATITVIPLTGLEKSLGYRVPEPMQGKIPLGGLVRVPLMNRTELAVVEAIGSDPAFPLARMKYILKLEQPFPVLTPNLIRLGRWMAVYYGAGLDAVFEAMMPAAVRKGMSLLERRYLRLGRRLDEVELAQLEKRAKRQAELYRLLAEQLHDAPLQRNTLLEKLGMSSAVADGLVAKGILQEVRSVERRDAYMDDVGDGERVTAERPQLNEEQAVAVDSIYASLKTGTFACHLLKGITGSGKTEVYLAAMQRALEEGGTVLFLVPEVALTPQTVGRLRSRLEEMSGVHAVVWHSHLSDGERFDAWHALATGDARVVVGARSAVFAPLANLRLILVDEEHEPAYKQEETPRYHGRDVAVYRGWLEEATVVLGSATPSLETLHNVQQGKYKMDLLTKRVDDRKLPLVHVVDMKREVHRSKGPSIFSRMLAEKMMDRFEKGEQTILFLNRRGFDASLHCPDCGFVAMCDHCDITLTHHKSDHILRCHMCGHEEYVPKVCPQCRSPKIHYKGSGTQKIEFFAQKILPKANVVRIDADTMQKKNRFREVLGDFRRGKIHVLVGTQMIAKGLDFPNVTLVGLMDADLSMHLPDFRAAERTFQLMVQVAGRSGRGDLAGEVVVQTFLPHASAIQFGRRQDYDGFVEEELEHRREFGYPPYRHLIHHLLRSKNREKLIFYADQWVKFLESELSEADGVEIRGPAPCPVERIQDYFRFQVWYFVATPSRLMPRLNSWRKSFKWDREIIEVVDVDAMNLI